MKSSETLIKELEQILYEYARFNFSDLVRQSIIAYVLSIRDTAQSEGRAMMLSLLCANSNTSFCVQCEKELSVEDYDFEVCRQCHADGGFSI